MQRRRRGVGEHARLSYQDVVANGAAVDPLPEEETAIIHPGIRRPTVRVLPAIGDVIRNEQAYLKRNVVDAPQAYRRIPKSQKRTIPINFGHVFFAIKMERLDVNLFREPHPQDAEMHMVAIKKLNKARVQHYLDRGGHENPYTNIIRMQTLGDDIHVLTCIEALEDDRYLYTIMQYCEGGILDMIPWDSPLNRGLQEDTVRQCMNKITRNLHYLQSHGIVHHDISPDNILSLNGELVLTDLAMSLRVPNGAQRRPLLRPQGTYGKAPYMTPEVFVNKTPFDGYATDVWASTCVLYNLLTSYHLYSQPHPTDVLFRYFLMAGGLSNEPLNERTVEVLADVYNDQNAQADQQNLMNRAMAHLHLSRPSLELLQKTLHLYPMMRNSLAQIMESDWMERTSK